MPSKKHPTHQHKAKPDNSILLKPTKLRSKALIAVIALLVASGLFLIYKSFAAGDSLSIVPASSSPALGSSFSVTIHENSNTDAVNAVEADLTYDATKLQFVSVSGSTGAFSGLVATQTGGGGTVSFAAATSTPVTGDQIVAVVTFTAIGTGTTNVSFAGTSALVTAASATNVLAATVGGSYTIADKTAPTVPSGLTAGTKTVNSIGISWTAATDNVAVSGYNIIRNGAKIGTSATASFNDTGLTPNTSYSYAIQAFDSAGNTSASSTALAISTLPDTTAPSVPTALTAGTKTVTTINLSWTGSTDNVAVTAYKVFRNGTQINTSGTTSYSDSGLTPNTSYSYTVAAVDGAGNTSAQSTALAISTLADTTAPSAPVGLISPSQTTNSINLSWTASTDNVAVTSYKIFRNGTQVGTSAVTSFSNTGLAQGTSYSFTVAAVDAAGNTSAQSTASSFATISKPGDVNGDGLVNITDLSIMAAHWQQAGTLSQGDLNGDGAVNVFDLSILASKWGT